MVEQRTKNPDVPKTLEELKKLGFNPDDPVMIAKSIYIEGCLGVSANAIIPSLLKNYGVTNNTIEKALYYMVVNMERLSEGVIEWENTHETLEVSDYIITGEPKI